MPLTSAEPAKIQFVEPMYALPVQSIPEGGGWLYEVKFDGYCCLAARDEKGVTMGSRRGNLFTDQFPHIARDVDGCPRAHCWTEIWSPWIKTAGSRSISSSIIVRRRRRSCSMRSTFSSTRGRSMLDFPLRARRKALGEIFEKLGKNAAPLGVSETIDATPAELVHVVREFGFEGIVAKRRLALRAGQAKRCLAQIPSQ